MISLRLFLGEAEHPGNLRTCQPDFSLLISQTYVPAWSMEDAGGLLFITKSNLHYDSQESMLTATISAIRVGRKNGIAAHPRTHELGS